MLHFASQSQRPDPDSRDMEKPMGLLVQFELSCLRLIRGTEDARGKKTSFLQLANATADCSRTQAPRTTRREHGISRRLQQCQAAHQHSSRS